jgi:hypothetical protein
MKREVAAIPCPARNTNLARMAGMNRTQAKYLLFGVTAVLLALVIFWPMLRAKEPLAKRPYVMVPSPPESAEPAISNAHIEQQDLSLDKISGLSGQQTLGLLARMTASERAELGRRFIFLAPNSLNNQKIALFFHAWSKFEPKVAFQMALNFQNKSQSWTALMSVFEGADPKDAMSLVTGLQQTAPGTVSPEVATSLLLTGLTKWASADGAGAAAWLDKFGGDLAPGIWKAVAETWGTLDPAAALAWISKQSDSALKETQMDGVMSGWVKTDLPAAAEYAREHLDGSIKSESRAALAANQLAAKDPKSAIAYTESLPEGSAKQLAQSMAATKWAYHDPAAAAAWVLSLPPDAQATAAAGVVAMWATQDPQASAAWINTLQGPARDSAVSAYSANLAPRDPGTALGWAQSISSDSIRTSTVDELVAQWLQRDPTRASEWINRSQLPEEEKMRLRSPRR